VRKLGEKGSLLQAARIAVSWSSSTFMGGVGSIVPLREVDIQPFGKANQLATAQSSFSFIRLKIFPIIGRGFDLLPQISTVLS